MIFLPKILDVNFKVLFIIQWISVLFCFADCVIMSSRLKSDVRRVEKSDSRRHREVELEHDDQEVESERKKHSSDTKRREEVHDIERSDERFHNRDYADQRKRRHRSDDETADSKSSGRSDRDEVRNRRRHGRDDDRQQQTDDRHSSANNTDRRDVEKEHHRDSETGNKKEVAEDDKYMKAKRAKVEDSLTTRTGGAYIPPARLKMMQVRAVQ